MRDREPYRPGQLVLWIGGGLHVEGPDGQLLEIQDGTVGTVVADDWPTDFVVSFPSITLCCDPSDLRPLDNPR